MRCSCCKKEAILHLDTACVLDVQIGLTHTAQTYILRWCETCLNKHFPFLLACLEDKYYRKLLESTGEVYVDKPTNQKHLIYPNNTFGKQKASVCKKSNHK